MAKIKPGFEGTEMQVQLHDTAARRGWNMTVVPETGDNVVSAVFRPLVVSRTNTASSVVMEALAKSFGEDGAPTNLEITNEEGETTVFYTGRATPALGQIVRGLVNIREG